MTMTKEYIQGLFDGEGCINIDRHRYITKNKTLTKYFYLNMSISNKNAECLRRVKEFLGYGTIYYEKKTQVYKLYFNEKESVELLNHIGSGLIVKREEVKLIKDFMNDKNELYFIELRNRRRGYKIT